MNRPSLYLGPSITHYVYTSNIYNLFNVATIKIVRKEYLDTNVLYATK